MADIQLESSWLEQLEDQFELPYMLKLRAFLATEKALGKVLYPPANLWFNALNSTPFAQAKVVILGQDPYHGPGQAHGLCFSVPSGIDIPPSLRNIYKELESDLAITPTNQGCLERWANQGVLLLNATLTVEARQAGSHQKQGWEEFTDCIVERLSAERENLVFILWGSYAQKKGANIDRGKHLVLEAPHPSPLSSYRGFFGSKPFSQANNYLSASGIDPIDWQIEY
jgi:uracil-DNA glycosylase